MFNDAREAEYKEFAAACRQMLAGKRKGEDLKTQISKHQRRFQEIRAVDYFDSPAVDDARMMLQRAEKAATRGSAGAALPKADPKAFVAKMWLTRPRPGIDRAGSAWLIRKFIDAKARFGFAMEPGKRPEAVPFDMADVEFSHHGDDCTFETLVNRFGITDKTVIRMAEMVHDADLEDEKFQRCECIGINAVLTGWGRTSISDRDLLEKGIECFEGLYRAMKR